MIGATQDTLDIEDTRRAVERTEKWREVMKGMPYLRFPADWEVAVIPPFAGAMARFLVRRGKARVSVYADYYQRLGIWEEPHWEIYPNAEDDNERFSIASETEAMLAAIAKSLDAQGIEARRAADSEAGAVEDESPTP